MLVHAKVKVGKELDSRAILADAACTRACLHSIVLPAASGAYKLTSIGRLDSTEAMVIVVFYVR